MAIKDKEFNKLLKKYPKDPFLKSVKIQDDNNAVFREVMATNKVNREGR